MLDWRVQVGNLAFRTPIAPPVDPAGSMVNPVDWPGTPACWLRNPAPKPLSIRTRAVRRRVADFSNGRIRSLPRDSLDVPERPAHWGRAGQQGRASCS